MNILGSTKLGSTITGHAELVNLAKEQAELNADIDAITIEDEIVERFIQCATHAMPYFSVRFHIYHLLKENTINIYTYINLYFRIPSNLPNLWYMFVINYYH